MDQIERNIVDHVASIGWSVMQVAPSADGGDPQEWFAYTIGLPKSFGWPELVCFGLDVSDMQLMLNDAVEECRQRNLTPKAGIELVDVLEGYPVRLVNGDHIPSEYLGYALWFAQQSESGGSLDRLQLVWPDKSARFPADTDCDEDIKRLQTPLETLQ